MTNQKDKKRFSIWDWDLVKLVLGVSLILFASFFIALGFTEDATRLAIRWSARISVACFGLAFGASAIHYFSKNSLSFWLLMNRKYLGISFALIHLSHLVFLLILQYAFHPVFTLAKRTSLMGGGLAYLFLVLMFVTSFDTYKSKLSLQNWKRLHTVGGYWIWLIYTRSYWKNVLFKENYNYLPLAVFLIVILVLRLGYLFLRKK